GEGSGILDRNAATRIILGRRYHGLWRKLAAIIHGQRDAVVTRMHDHFVDRYLDGLTGTKRRDLTGRSATALVAARSELLGKSERVLRHPRVRRHQDEVRARNIQRISEPQSHRE